MQKLNIALIGYGAMGKEIERIAMLKGINITEIFDIDNPIAPDGDYKFDVAVDFSFPNAVMYNVRTVAKLKKNLVIGTTGWNAHHDEVKSIVEKAGIGCIYAANFSVGMCVFKKIVALAARSINDFDEYDTAIFETHHTRKKDHPSGTALVLANEIIENMARKTKITVGLDQGEPIKKDELLVSYSRLGDIAGTHTVYFDSPSDTIELTHRAKNRSGLAKGAVFAAEYIFGKTGFYKFEDII